MNKTKHLDDNLNTFAKQMIGKTEQEAEELALKNDLYIHTAYINGVGQMNICDVVPSRFNLTIENGIVTKVTFG